MNFCDTINPSNIKKDADMILDFLVKRLKVKGKIGVYGRSLGGIASTHLAREYQNIISSLIVDRTFCELDISSERRMSGSCSKFLYKFVSCSWKSRNDSNFILADKCFKIVTCDPLDDVVDNFSALPTGVALKVAQKPYNEEKWSKFFDSLIFLYHLEH